MSGNAGRWGLGVIVAIAGLIVGCSSEPAGDTNMNGGTGNEVNGSLVFKKAWEGEWNVVLTFRDCTTLSTIAIDDITDVICAGDTLDLQIGGLLNNCTGTMSDTRVMVDCTYQFADAGCDVTASLTLDMERQGDTITGAGSWSAAVSGSCAPVYAAGCERFDISGTRITKTPSACVTANSSVADRFGLRPRLFLRPRR